MAIHFNRDVLRQHGLELEETSDGFVIHAPNTMPREALDGLFQIGRDLGLDVGDQENLVGHAADLTCWAALKSSTKESERVAVMGKPEPGPKGRRTKQAL